MHTTLPSNYEIPPGIQIAVKSTKNRQLNPIWHQQLAYVTTRLQTINTETNERNKSSQFCTRFKTNRISEPFLQLTTEDDEDNFW